jgi:hypothetical protein
MSHELDVKKRPANSKKRASGTATNNERPEWVNIRLGKADYEHLEKILTNGTFDGLSFLSELIDSGMTLSIAGADQGATVRVSCYETVKQPGNDSRLALSGFGDSLETAVSSLFYKFHVILDGELHQPANDYRFG